MQAQDASVVGIAVEQRLGGDPAAGKTPGGHPPAGEGPAGDRAAGNTTVVARAMVAAVLAALDVVVEHWAFSAEPIALGDLFHRVTGAVGDHD